MLNSCSRLRLAAATRHNSPLININHWVARRAESGDMKPVILKVDVGGVLSSFETSLTSLVHETKEEASLHEPSMWSNCEAIESL